MTHPEEMKLRVKYVVKATVKVIFGIVLISLLALLVGYVVMLLWNWLMPELFGLSTIGFWQSVGLIILAKILFGGFNSNGRNKSRKGRGRFEKRLRNRLEERCRDNGTTKWQMYDQFWKDEGQAAYQAYIERRKKQEEEE